MGTIHILPTDKPSRFVTSKENKKCYLYSIEEFKNIDKFIEYDSKSWDSQNIYITNSKEIKVGEWVIYTKGIKIHCKKLDNKEDVELANIENSGVLKIILTTDQELILDGVQDIKDEFLEWFVKNPSCEEVEVEMNQGRYYDYGGNVHITNAYKIIIPQEEEFKNSNNLQGSIIDSSTENNSFYLPKEKRVMVKFNDDEPMHINSIYGIGNFIISLKEGENIKFQNNGKTFELYIETT
jgi:hypothetical protein